MLPMWLGLVTVCVLDKYCATYVCVRICVIYKLLNIYLCYLLLSLVATTRNVQIRRSTQSVLLYQY